MTIGNSADRTLTRLSSWMSAAAFTGVVALAHLPPRAHLPDRALPVQSKNDEQTQRSTAAVSVQDQALPTPLRRAEAPAAALPDAAPEDVTVEARAAVPQVEAGKKPEAVSPNDGGEKPAPAHRPVAAGKNIAAADTQPVAGSNGNSNADAPRELEPIVRAAPPPDEWTAEQLAAELRTCLQVLAPAAAEIELADPMKKGACGTPAPLSLRRVGGSSGVEFSPPPTMNCRLAASLGDWVEKVLQPSAEKVLGSRIKRIIGASSYSCRNIYNNPKLTLSEHATGNAIDISAFVTADGRTVTVAKAWGPTDRDIVAAQKKAEAKKVVAVAGAAGGAKGSATVPPLNADPADKSGNNPGNKSGSKPATAARGGTGKSAANLQKTDYRRGHPETRQNTSEADPKDGSGAGATKNTSDAKAAKAAGAEKGRAEDANGGGKTAALMPATTKEANFLKRLHEGSCGMFSTVLGPEANEAHRDHFHLDIKIRRSKTPICR